MEEILSQLKSGELSLDEILGVLGDACGCYIESRPFDFIPSAEDISKMAQMAVRSQTVELDEILAFLGDTFDVSIEARAFDHVPSADEILTEVRATPRELRAELLEYLVNETGHGPVIMGQEAVTSLFDRLGRDELVADMERLRHELQASEAARVQAEQSAQQVHADLLAVQVEMNKYRHLATSAQVHALQLAEQLTSVRATLSTPPSSSGSSSAFFPAASSASPAPPMMLSRPSTPFVQTFFPTPTAAAAARPATPRPPTPRAGTPRAGTPRAGTPSEEYDLPDEVLEEPVVIGDRDFDLYMSTAGVGVNADVQAADASDPHRGIDPVAPALTADEPTRVNKFSSGRFGCKNCGEIHQNAKLCGDTDLPCVRTNIRMVKDFLIRYDVAPNQRWRELFRRRTAGCATAMYERFLTILLPSDVVPDDAWARTIQKRALSTQRCKYQFWAGTCKDLHERGMIDQFAKPRSHLHGTSKMSTVEAVLLNPRDPETGVTQRKRPRSRSISSSLGGGGGGGPNMAYAEAAAASQAAAAADGLVSAPLMFGGGGWDDAFGTTFGELPSFVTSMLEL